MAAMVAATPLNSFLDAVGKATSDVLTRECGDQWSARIDRETATAAQKDSISFRCSASGGLRGEASLQLSATDAVVLAQKALAESADSSGELNPRREEALEKLLGQITESVCANLRGSFGETRLELQDKANGAENPTTQEFSFALQSSQAPSAKLTLRLRISPELQASVSSKALASSNAPAAAESGGGNPQQPNIDLLLGVNLSLTLRFGRRVLTLREILDLNSGSVVELDQEVQEPADLLLGDKLIARGQVVIVDGNYGLQITEVADTHQRMGTL